MADEFTDPGFRPHKEVPPADGSAVPSVRRGLFRGFSRRCPRCGDGRLFSRYTTVNPCCGRCGLDLASFRADDAPPYFTIVAVGHVIIPLLLKTEQIWHPPGWVHIALWIPLTLLLTLVLLPPIKGAVIGAQWAFRIRG